MLGAARGRLDQHKAIAVLEGHFALEPGISARRDGVIVIGTRWPFAQSARR
jgi:hypothetical protein